MTTNILKTLKNPITYKISNDIFLVSLLASLLFVTTEILIPGLISSYVSPLSLFVILFGLLLFISFIAHTQNIHVPITKSKKSKLVLSAILFTLLISISGFRYGYLFTIIISIFAVSIFVLLHKAVQEMLDNE